MPFEIIMNKIHAWVPSTVYLLFLLLQGSILYFRVWIRPVKVLFVHSGQQRSHFLREASKQRMLKDQVWFLAPRRCNSAAAQVPTPNSMENAAGDGTCAPWVEHGQNSRHNWAQRICCGRDAFALVCLHFDPSIWPVKSTTNWMDSFVFWKHVVSKRSLERSLSHNYSRDTNKDRVCQGGHAQQHTCRQPACICKYTNDTSSCCSYSLSIFSFTTDVTVTLVLVVWQRKPAKCRRNKASAGSREEHLHCARLVECVLHRVHFCDLFRSNLLFPAEAGDHAAVCEIPHCWERKRSDPQQPHQNSDTDEHRGCRWLGLLHHL